MDQVRFRVLGPMEIVVAGASCPLPSTAERALLVQLVLAAGRTVPATLLIDRLWAEGVLPADPANALQTRVSKLRRSLSSIGLPDLVVREGIGYRAQIDPARVDALDFEQRLRAARLDDGAVEARLSTYDEALALWRGEPLVDFPADSWAIAESARFRELRLVALTERTELALNAGRHVEVVQDLEPVVTADPTLEPLVGLLMKALYRVGRQAEALDVFTRTRDFLDNELGLEPSRALRSIHEQVLRQDPSLAPTTDDPPPSAARPETRAGPTRTNLPTVERPLIGRDEQLESLEVLLASSRLVTLVGPGGAGKTAMALASVVRAASHFGDGVFGVRLASAQTVDDVPLAVADALSVPLDGAATGRSVVERVLNFLGDKHLLLLLDNCEHVVDAIAGVVDDILGRCPSVTILTTSREALAVPGEVQVSITPLDVPAPHASDSDVRTSPAVQLFLERAAGVRPALGADPEVLADAARIVRSLDGIPLAIELAAARVSSMSTTEIASRLDQRFSLLTWGARTADARQRTLRAAVDWSYALLTPAEQVAFNRLSVFQGGWNLAAAEAVVGDVGRPSDEVINLVARLVEQSMVVVESGTTTRYRMLETLRQYASEELAESGEASEVRTRHAAFFRDLALRFEVEVRGSGQRKTMHRLREEQPNLRAALAWYAGEGDDIDAALETAGALGLFWHLGRHLEGRDLLADLLGPGRGAPVARAKALQAVSIVERPRACLVHPSPRCAETAAESLAVFEAQGDRWRAALSKALLAVEGVAGSDSESQSLMLDEAEAAFRDEGDDWGHAVVGFVRMETALKNGAVTTAIEVGHQAADEFRRLDDPWGLSAILYHLGWGLRQFGRYAEAGPVLEEAITVAEVAGLFNTVQWALADLAVLRTFQGRYDEAGALFRRAAEASAHVGDGAGEVLASYGFALLAQLDGDWTAARSGYEAAVDGFRSLGTPVPEGLAQWGLARCDEVVGDDEAALAGFEEALRIGQTLGEPGLSASALEGMARVARRRGATARAAARAAQAADIRSRFARPAPPHERQDAITPPRSPVS